MIPILLLLRSYKLTFVLEKSVFCLLWQATIIDLNFEPSFSVLALIIFMCQWICFFSFFRESVFCLKRLQFFGLSVSAIFSSMVPNRFASFCKIFLLIWDPNSYPILSKLLSIFFVVLSKALKIYYHSLSIYISFITIPDLLSHSWLLSPNFHKTYLSACKLFLSKKMIYWVDWTAA